MNRLVPIAAFSLVGLAAVAWAGIEVLTLLAHPAVDRFPEPGGAGAVILYHKTKRSRAADLLFEYPDGQLHPVVPVYYAGKNREGGGEVPFDALNWTADGAAVFATGRDGGLLWLFEPATRDLFAGRLANERFDAHGGAGQLVVRWFELGSTRDSKRLWSWETTRYEHAVEALH
jgi:hypothetical protein